MDCYLLLALYRCVKRAESTETGIASPDIICRDGMIPTTEAPERYETSRDWKISEKDIIPLDLGPPTSAGVTIVPALSRKERVGTIILKFIKVLSQGLFS